MSEHPHVQLGAHSLPVYAQPWRRIVKRLERVFDALQEAVDASGEFSAEAFVGGLGGRLYETLTTFIPNLPDWLPEHEFNGYKTPEAYRLDQYDEADDPAPTFPQFIDAFDTIVGVNGGKRFLDALGKVFDPKMIRAEATLALSEWRERSTGSPSSPGTSGASPPNSSTPSTPTEDPLATPEFVRGSEWMKEPSSGSLLATSV